MSSAPSSHLGSTYRLQLNGLGFAGAQRMVEFLHDLGVETCYVSPVSRARTGSTHGYDVVDPTVLDPALGTPEEFESFLATLAGHGMGLLIDIVPNHMAASVENPFFADVLRLGRESEFASYFDIAWDEQDGKVLLPVLGRPLDEALAAGEIRYLPEDPPVVTYFEHRYPVAPGSGAGSVADLLASQHYRLADWRVANHEVNYRRFFDINELIAVRQEDPAVFVAAHGLVAALAADPRVVGVRVDHVDGLHDPAGYLAMLRDVCQRSGTAPAVVVEKILAAGEVLPDWPVAGTTGYEFGVMLVGLFVDPSGATDLTRATALATGDDRTFAERAIEAKRRAIDTLFPHQLDQVTAKVMTALSSGGDVDLARGDVAAAVRELTAQLSVYRTYRRPGEAPTATDLEWLRAAADLARPQLSGASVAGLDRIVGLVGGDHDAAGAAWQAVSAWQQLSGPVAAKGVEDTAMYGSGRLLATADVGSDPDRPAVSPAEFHAEMTARLESGRAGLSTTSTHDSKRSHDVRCRLAVLSEIAAEWESTVQALDDELLSTAGEPGPDAADRRYLYETLVGIWPATGAVDAAFAARIDTHVVKAARESKRHTNWLDPDEWYEAALRRLAHRIVGGESPAAGRLIEAIVASIERAGAVNSIASVLLKATAPGVPDTYQGDDAWFFALVDPDNRAPIDEQRDGAVKQDVLRRSLEARRAAPELFADGRYQPLDVMGTWQDHIVAFARIDDTGCAITVVPRLVHALAATQGFPLGACWADTEVQLPAGCPTSFTELLTDRSISTANGRIAISELFTKLPVALLRD